MFATSVKRVGRFARVASLPVLVIGFLLAAGGWGGSALLEGAEGEEGSPELAFLFFVVEGGG